MIDFLQTRLTSLARAMKEGAAEVDAYLLQLLREESGDCIAAENPPGLGESSPGRNVGERAGIEVVSVLDDDSDNELTIIATKGNNALADFPHSPWSTTSASTSTHSNGEEEIEIGA